MKFSELSALWRHPEFRRGARDMIGITLGISAWGLVTGVAMIKSGLSVPLALLMSLIVYAGSSQLAVVPLMPSGAFTLRICRAHSASSWATLPPI